MGAFFMSKIPRPHPLNPAYFQPQFYLYLLFRYRSPSAITLKDPERKVSPYQ
jgi:hypothetical protein